MKILSIETSCDETAISLVEAKSLSGNQLEFKILGNALATQIELHREYGGVFPILAKREHGKALIPLLNDVLKQANEYSEIAETVDESKNEILNLLDREKELQILFPHLFLLKKPSIDLIAVTEGPGLEPALWVGISFAKALSQLWKIPTIGVNHMEGHILSALAPTKGNTIITEEFEFPALSLLISGGHTELVLVKKFGEYEKIGETVDDAVGEAFDKVARMLGLPYPGGPEISKLASEYKKEYSYVLPRPMIHSNDYQFSYSGLKTAVLYLIRDLKATSSNNELSLEQKSAIAREFQEAAIEVLLKKTARAAEEYATQTILIGGGVARNERLRKLFQATLGQSHTLLFPRDDITTDNALMIAFAGFVEWSKKKSAQNNLDALVANGNLSF